MAELTNPITADGTYTTPITPGKYYSFGTAGTWGSGSLAIKWTDGAGNSVALPDSPLTSDGGFVFCAPTPTLTLVLSGATNPSLTVSIATVV